MDGLLYCGLNLLCYGVDSMIHTSTCGDISMKGTAKDLVRKYEGLAYAAERAGDDMKATILRQQAEHWKRVQK